MSATATSRLRAELLARYSLLPSDQWLQNFLSTGYNPSHPLPALTSTANFRLQSTDFTTSLSTTRERIFPANIADVSVKELTLAEDIPVQVLDIRDVSTSNWSQIEAIERFERGEEIRGREIVRNVPGTNDDDGDGAGEHNQTSTAQSGPPALNQIGPSRKGSTGPHKLLVQDAAGVKVWAFELLRLDRITIINQNPPAPGSTLQPPVEGMQIGCKLLLKKGTKVRRALIMLTPASTTVMGGKIELWDQKWREGRKVRLTQEMEAGSPA